MRVLVVEDYAPIRKAVAKSLREAGFAVDETGDGEEGLWYATSNDYDEGAPSGRPAQQPRRARVCQAGSAVVARDRTGPRRGRAKGHRWGGPFNVLNRVNYNPYVGNMSSPFFGQSVSAQPARRFQLSLRLEF